MLSYESSRSQPVHTITINMNMLLHSRIVKAIGDWGVTKRGDTPHFCRDTEGYHHVEEVGLQALCPVTLMITHYSPV